ncbi:hypothetical protein [Nocardia panacis]|nr:hypothetical protein [Nocardia panacis]
MDIAFRAAEIRDRSGAERAVGGVGDLAEAVQAETLAQLIQSGLIQLSG